MCMLNDESEIESTCSSPVWDVHGKGDRIKQVSSDLRLLGLHRPVAHQDQQVGIGEKYETGRCLERSGQQRLALLEVEPSPDS